MTGKFSRIDIFGQNGNDGEHYDALSYEDKIKYMQDKGERYYSNDLYEWKRFLNMFNIAFKEQPKGSGVELVLYNGSYIEFNKDGDFLNIL